MKKQPIALGQSQKWAPFHIRGLWEALDLGEGIGQASFERHGNHIARFYEVEEEATGPTMVFPLSCQIFQMK